MSLINCKECNKKISSSVKNCPECGSSKHRSFIKKHPIITVFMSLFIIGSISQVLFEDNKTYKNNNKLEVANEKTTIIQNNLESHNVTQNNIKNEEPVKNSEIEKIENWEYSINEDKMRGTKNIYASTESKNTLPLGFPYNDSKMQITIRKMEKETNVLITLKGQIVCNSYSERCYVSVKSDDNKIVQYDFTEAAHGRSDLVFINKEKEFIELLKKSKNLIVEVPLFNYGRQQYNFDVSGLKWDE